MHQKLTILLIDDRPTFCKRQIPRDFVDVVLPEQFSEHFRLFWIKYARDARDLLNGFDLLNYRNPAALGELCLPPEIVIFDYALTHPIDGEQPRDSDTNILERVVLELEQIGTPLRDTSREEILGPKTREFGNDCTGVYVGVSLARAFGGYPCGAIPTTARITNTALINTEAAFYEWLHQDYFRNRFDEKETTVPTWDLWIKRGVRAFRERVESLARAGLIRLSLSDINEVIQSPNEKQAIRIYSRYGKRSLPLMGIFADFLLCEPKRSADFEPAANKWAIGLQSALFRSTAPTAFNAARVIAEKYNEAYVSLERDDRAFLSILATKSNLDPDAEDELHKLCDLYGLNYSDVRVAPLEQKISAKHKSVWPHWRNNCNKDDVVARWAALMLMVWAELHARVGKTNEIKKIIFNDPEMQDDQNGPFDPEVLVERYGREIIDQSIKKGDLVARKKGELVFPLPQPVEKSTIYRMLDPLPEQVVLETKQQHNTLEVALNRLGDKCDKSLSLSISDVLSNRPFGERVGANAKKQVNSGLQPGERELLQLYADDLGFSEELWPDWLKNG